MPPCLPFSCSACGLPILLWRREGLIALVVFLCSILPYAWTWNIPGGGEWRFTLPVYPLYLVSAAVGGETLVRTAFGLMGRASRRETAVNAARFVVTGALMAASFLWVSRWLDGLRVAEEIGQRRPALIEPGWQAGFFFKSGWTWTRPAGQAAVATLAGSEGHVRLPVPEGVGARVVMRLGSIQESGRPVEIFLGERRLGSISGSRDRGGIASVDIAPGSPRSFGFVELRFRDGPRSEGPPLTLLWLRIDPIRPGP